MRFSTWKKDYPDATVVTFETGHTRDYQRNPYTRYFQSDRLMFPVKPIDKRLSLKEPVVGVRIGDTARAYPVRRVQKAKGGRFEDTIAGKRIVLQARGSRVGVVEAPADAKVVHTFWFAWAAFHPETEIH
jgi:hypothetical protein